MLDIGFLLAVIPSLAFCALSAPFLKELKSEAPALYESFGAPSVGWYLWNRKLLMPYSWLILSGQYRSVLANYPKSRAWASWLFLVHWLQLCAVVAFVFVMFH